ncbi:Protein EARLY RESPONSIVE TO DEHYDRATION 15 [Platanthera zijinensis]|uniref:Protein EARLY RESPONSIVE TO DEHYDRATION 15 n=1 Tax=Platanthera zijinensis TaxID=2320716 RepID=A0AAP0BJY2_9ASPA
MATMAVASGVRSSTLNPNAPLFIPASFQQVEDFSPEWWELVKTTSWFRDHWFHQHKEQETFDGDEEEEDVAKLLPDSFDLGIDEEFSHFQDQAAFIDTGKNVFNSADRFSGLEAESEEFIRNLTLKSPKSTTAKSVADTARYKEKLVHGMSPPKFSPRRIIQQPR